MDLIREDGGFICTALKAWYKTAGLDDIREAGG
ncbi:hypothetical protein ACVWWG_009195 [Bradyrhizobium sp. LB7.2]